MNNELLRASDLAGIVQANALAIQNVVSVQMNMQNDLAKVKDEIKEFKDNTEINENQKYEISQLTKDMVKEIVEQNDFDYKKSSRYIFNDIYGTLKRKFRVTSYARIKIGCYQDALKIVRDYKLSDTARERILEAS